MDEKGFQAMTSYSQKSENVADLHVRISSPGPHGRSYSSSQPSRQYTHRDNSVILSSSRTYSPPSSYPQDIYSHESTSSMMDAPPRYPESSQRTLQHRYDHDFDYGYDSSSTYVGDSIHTNPSSNPTHEHHTAQRYPSVATDNTYRSDLQTPLSLNMGSTSMDLQLPPMGSRLPSAPPVVDYRQSVRGYHSIESHTLQHQWHPLQQHPSHDTHDHGHLQGPGFYSSSHLASRRGSAAPKPLQHSHPQTQQQQQHLSPLTYESSVGGGTSYPGSSGGNHNSHSTDARALTHSVGSYPSTHASSSIPMCNSQSRPLYPNIHEEQHQNKLGNDLQHAHSQHQHQIPHTNLDRNASSSAASPAGFHSTDPKPVNGQLASSSFPTLALKQPHSNPRFQSTPDLLRISTDVQPLSAIPSYRLSPLPTSDDGSTVGSESTPLEDGERDREEGSKWSLVDGQGGNGGVKEDGVTGGSAGEGGPEDGASGRAQKKKKKSKMHECAVCGKKFPRPSGLKTHMNIHSNEKPYPCGFPGCSRTFGVRSNAKRHLRTHGVYPAPANSSPPVDPPYVVGFSTPMVLPPQPQDISLRGAGIGSDGLQSELHSVKIDGAEDQSGFAGGQDAGQPSQNHMSRASAFKLRWMPPSLTSRTNASLLREVRDGQISDDHAHGLWQNRGPWTRTPMKVDEEDEEEGGDFTMDMDVKEEDRESDTVRDDGKYGDGASAERFSIPLRPILPSFASVSTGLSLASRDGSNASSLGLGSATSYGSVGCTCIPRCPSSSSGSSKCRSSSSASFTSFTSISPSTSATSFATPSPSASNSLLLPSSSVYGHRKPAGARELDLNGSLNMDFEERNSYMSVGSHPYHPSQFSVLPGPAVASAATTYVVA